MNFRQARLIWTYISELGGRYNLGYLSQMYNPRYPGQNVHISGLGEEDNSKCPGQIDIYQELGGGDNLRQSSPKWAGWRG